MKKCANLNQDSNMKVRTNLQMFASLKQSNKNIHRDSNRTEFTAQLVGREDRNYVPRHSHERLIEMSKTSQIYTHWNRRTKLGFKFPIVRGFSIWWWEGKYSKRKEKHQPGIFQTTVKTRYRQIEPTKLPIVEITSIYAHCSRKPHSLQYPRGASIP